MCTFRKGSLPVGGVPLLGGALHQFEVTLGGIVVWGPVVQWLVRRFPAERKVAGSIPTIGDFHTVGPCKKAVFACLATDV